MDSEGAAVTLDRNWRTLCRTNEIGAVAMVYRSPNTRHPPVRPPLRVQRLHLEDHAVGASETAMVRAGHLAGSSLSWALPAAKCCNSANRAVFAR